jgi:hypothetical protein
MIMMMMIIDIAVAPGIALPMSDDVLFYVFVYRRIMPLFATITFEVERSVTIHFA